MTQIEIVRGDIVQQEVDAIVNAANSSLLGGGGVDGAIHRAAGQELYQACLMHNGCKTGDAKITPGFRLKARHVIHAVGPRYNGQEHDAVLLASAYRRSLELASKHGIRSIAFPAISTGIYGYPLDEAAPIAVNTVREYVSDHPEIELVRFVLWHDEAYAVFEQAMTQGES
ncbi:MAG TPA: O-acetyl-ADP-ribose deacetylase [Herpetosiphonaceae bacterium]|nr:O-acetyl-ADP-ribose deacetylase [Herpetosiphonaceae bacterium]